MDENQNMNNGQQTYGDQQYNNGQQTYGNQQYNNGQQTYGDQQYNGGQQTYGNPQYSQNNWTPQEQHGPVKMILLNNNYLGNVRQWQDLMFGGRHSFTIFMQGTSVSPSPK